MREQCHCYIDYMDFTKLPFIVYCPMHKAAPAMLAALLAMMPGMEPSPMKEHIDALVVEADGMGFLDRGQAEEFEIRGKMYPGDMTPPPEEPKRCDE